MAEMHADLTDEDHVAVTHDATGARWDFDIVTDGSGRRHLGGPHRAEEGAVPDDLLRQACVLAQSEALHAGRIDY